MKYVGGTALRVVRGDGKGTQCPGYIWATLFLGDINTGNWLSRLKESQELGQENMVLTLAGTLRAGLCRRGNGSNNKLQTRPLVKEGATN
jgi:hypothetical protein